MTELEKAKSESDEKVQTDSKAQKLQEELTETQNEADELRGIVVRFMAELERTRTESEEKIRATDSEAKNLQEELRRMKDKLSETNAEIIKQASEHLKQRQEIEAELEQSKETASALQKRVLFMDDQLTQAETEAEQLRNALSPPRGQPLVKGVVSSRSSTWKQSFAGMAESIKSSFSDTGEGPIIIPEAPLPDAKTSVIERLRNTLDPNYSPDR